MADFFSKRFGKNVWLTAHARESMVRRAVDLAVLEQVIECGVVKQANALNFWVYQHVEGRADNLICAAVHAQAALVVKTVMINWSLED